MHIYCTVERHPAISLPKTREDGDSSLPVCEFKDREPHILIGNPGNEDAEERDAIFGNLF